MNSAHPGHSTGSARACGSTTSPAIPCDNLFAQAETLGFGNAERS